MGGGAAWYNGVMASENLNLSVDRSVFFVSSLKEPTDEVAYWQTKTPIERLEALELMRQVLYAYDPLTTRLQRVFTITERL